MPDAPLVPPAGEVRLASPCGRWVLAATIGASSMAMLDSTVVNVALPRLRDDLGADFGALQWIITAYTLTLASFILIGGSLGDRLGRVRVLVVGTGWFAVASALCGVAPDAGFLVVARLLQGVGAALVTPGSLALISATFHPDDRGRAIGAWSGIGGVAVAIGPVVGGALIEVSWRWVFFLNLPVAAAVVLIARLRVPESRDERARGQRIDLPGAVLATLGLGVATLGLIDRSLPVTIGGGVLLVAFAVVERRSAAPMVPPSLFHSRPFTVANGLTLVVYGALAAVFFLVGLVLQETMGYSPIEAGAALLPVTLIMLAGSATVGGWAQRHGPRLPLTVGPLVLAAGMAAMVRIEPGSSYGGAVLPSVGLFGLGLVVTVAPLTFTVLDAAGPAEAGVASGVNNAVARSGGLLAVASLPLWAGISTSEVVAGTELVDGFHTAVLVAAVATAVAAVGVGLALGRPARVEAEPCWHCGVDATPTAVAATAGVAREVEG